MSEKSAAIQLRVALTEAQASNLQKRLAQMPFKLQYQEEQHGPALVACIGCTPAQEKTVREMLHEIGAPIEPVPED